MIDIEALESMLNTAIDTVKLAEQKVREDEMANSLQIARRFNEVIKPDVLRARDLMYRAGLRDDIYRAPADDQHMVRTIGFTNTPRNWLQIKSKAGMSYRVCLTDTAQEIAKYLYDLDLTRNFIYKVLTNWDFYRDQIFTFVQKEITRELLRRAEKANVNEKLAEKIRKELTEE